MSVEPFRPFRYLDEETSARNNREDIKDGQRFSLAVSQIVGKRLTFDQSAGKAEAQA